MKIPTMLDLPEQFLTLQTPRLILRKLEITDAADIFAYAHDPEVSTYTCGKRISQLMRLTNI